MKARPTQSSQRSKRGKHLGVGEVRVAAARIRQHEDDGTAAQRLGLQTCCDRTLVLGKDRPEHRHADKRDDPRPKLPDLGEQPFPSSDIFFGP